MRHVAHGVGPLSRFAPAPPEREQTEGAGLLPLWGRRRRAPEGAKPGATLETNAFSHYKGFG